MIEIEIRLFNALARYAGKNNPMRLELPSRSTVGDVLQRLPVPEKEIFLLTHNGRNLMCGFGFGSGIETAHELEDGDVVALSGPIPFSRGYGSPVI